MKQRFSHRPCMRSLQGPSPSCPWPTVPKRTRNPLHPHALLFSSDDTHPTDLFLHCRLDGRDPQAHLGSKETQKGGREEQNSKQA